MDEDELQNNAINAVMRFDNHEVKKLLGYDPSRDVFDYMSALAFEFMNLHAIVLLAAYAEERSWRLGWAPHLRFSIQVNDLLAVLVEPAMLERTLLEAAISAQAEWATFLVRRYRVDARRVAVFTEREADFHVGFGNVIRGRIAEMVAIQRALERWDRVRIAVRRRRSLRRLFFAWLGVHVKERYGKDGIGRRRDREEFEAEFGVCV
jgi:hypothetical protein